MTVILAVIHLDRMHMTHKANAGTLSVFLFRMKTISFGHLNESTIWTRTTAMLRQQPRARPRAPRGNLNLILLTLNVGNAFATFATFFGDRSPSCNPKTHPATLKSFSVLACCDASVVKHWCQEQDGAGLPASHKTLSYPQPNRAYPGARAMAVLPALKKSLRSL